MSASKAETIMQAIVAALTVPPMTAVPAADVYRDLNYAIGATVNSAVTIEEGDEPEPDTSTLSIAYRMLDVRVIGIGRGATTAATLADAALVEAHNRIMADRTLGGNAMAVFEGETTRQRDAIEQPVAIFTKTYRVEYRTAETSLET